MYFLKFSGGCVKQKLRLVTYPVDIYLFAGDSFHNHADSIRTVILRNKAFKMLAELCVLVTGRTLLFVFQPQIKQVCLTAR